MAADKLDDILIDAVKCNNVDFIKSITNNKHVYITSDAYEHCDNICQNKDVYKHLVMLMISNSVYRFNTYNNKMIISKACQTGNCFKLSVWCELYHNKITCDDLIEFFKTCSSADAMNTFLPVIDKKASTFKSRRLIKLFLETSISSTMYKSIYQFIMRYYTVEDIVEECIHNNKPILLDYVLPDFIKIYDGEQLNEKLYSKLSNILHRYGISTSIFAVLHQHGINIAVLVFSDITKLELYINYGIDILTENQRNNIKVRIDYTMQKMTEIFIDIKDWDDDIITSSICEYLLPKIKK